MSNTTQTDRRLVYGMHALFIGPLLICIGMNKGKLPSWMFTLLLVMGVMATLYHSYKFVLEMRREGFVRQGGYLGRPLESFVPFSFPYNRDSKSYYSYHDDSHNRNDGSEEHNLGCNCIHNENKPACNCKAHQQQNVNNNTVVEEFMMPGSNLNKETFGMSTVVPGM